MKHLRYEKEFSFMRLVGSFSFSTELWGQESKGFKECKLISLNVAKEFDIYFVSITFLPVLIIIGFNRWPL